MNILDEVLHSENGRAGSQIAAALGIEEREAKSAISQLLPVLARGLSQGASSQDGLTSLLGALTKGQHQRYLETPGLLGHSDTVRDGNGILGHVFGSKDVSRQVATRAATSTGLGVDIVKKMLPMVASLAMGALSQKASGAGMLGVGARTSATDGLRGLASFLDFDGDGSIADDVLGILGKRFH